MSKMKKSLLSDDVQRIIEDISHTLDKVTEVTQLYSEPGLRVADLSRNHLIRTLEGLSNQALNTAQELRGMQSDTSWRWRQLDMTDPDLDYDRRREEAGDGWP